MRDISDLVRRGTGWQEYIGNFLGIVHVSLVTYSMASPPGVELLVLMNSTPQVSEVLCAGIIVADHVCTPISHLPAPGELVMADRLLLTLGGCAANTAVDLAKMGVRSAVSGRVGADLFGRIVADMLREAQVDTSALKAVSNQDTSQTLIVNVVGQDRRYIHTFGANAGFRASDINPNGCKILYVGGFLLMEELTGTDLAKLFRDARSRGVKTFLDVVTPPGIDYMAQLKPVLPFTDVFKPNADEARLITGEIDTRRQAQFFRDLGVKTAIISGGHDGSLLVNNEGTFHAGVYPIDFVDGSGGGDAFDAGFIYGMLNNLSTEDCLRYASALAPVACGPSAPRRASSPGPNAKPSSASTPCRSNACSELPAWNASSTAKNRTKADIREFKLITCFCRNPLIVNRLHRDFEHIENFVRFVHPSVRPDVRPLVRPVCSRTALACGTSGRHNTGLEAANMTDSSRTAHAVRSKLPELYISTLIGAILENESRQSLP